MCVHLLQCANASQYLLNEHMLSLNYTSAQYRQCLQCYCYTLTVMPTRQAGNQPTHKQTTLKYERFISTDDLSRRHSGNAAENN